MNLLFIIILTIWGYVDINNHFLRLRYEKKIFFVNSWQWMPMTRLSFTNITSKIVIRTKLKINYLIINIIACCPFYKIGLPLNMLDQNKLKRNSCILKWQKEYEIFYYMIRHDKWSGSEFRDRRASSWLTFNLSGR